MTKNQIEYAKLEETRRNNRNQLDLQRETMIRDIQIRGAANAETRRSNQAKEAYNMLNLEETRRHNLAGESYNLGKLQEESRHNLASEGLSTRQNELREAELAVERARNAETIRSNIARETETVRSNRAKEEENVRHNRQAEQASWYSASAAMARAQAQRDVGLAQVANANEANRIRSAELGSLNSYRGRQINVDLLHLGETAKHNRMTESENNRHNVALEGINTRDIAERTRHNTQTELVDSRNATSNRIRSLSDAVGTASDVILDWTRRRK